MLCWLRERWKNTENYWGKNTIFSEHLANVYYCLISNECWVDLYCLISTSLPHSRPITSPPSWQKEPYWKYHVTMVYMYICMYARSLLHTRRLLVCMFIWKLLYLQYIFFLFSMTSRVFDFCFASFYGWQIKQSKI